METRRRLLYKIAKAYYDDNLTQSQIGDLFGLSRIKVSRLLHQAREERVVQITVVSPEQPSGDLERNLEAKYGLKEVVVVSPSDYEKTTVLRELGEAAAACLIRCLNGDEVVGVTWGSTLLAVVDALPDVAKWPNMRVVQMLGGLGRPETEVHATDLTRRLAQAFGARPWSLPAPGIVSSKQLRDALLEDIQISETLALAAQADVALVGIGRPTSDSVLIRTGTILTMAQVDDFKARGAVGDIGLRFFDEQGQVSDIEINDRLIGVTLDQIKKIPRVIGVAGTEYKYPAILAALRGQLIEVLVTDERIATRLLDEDMPPRS